MPTSDPPRWYLPAFTTGTSTRIVNNMQNVVGVDYARHIEPVVDTTLTRERLQELPDSAEARTARDTTEFANDFNTDNMRYRATERYLNPVVLDPRAVFGSSPAGGEAVLTRDYLGRRREQTYHDVEPEDL